MNKNIGIIIGIIVIAGIGYFAFSGDKMEKKGNVDYGWKVEEGEKINGESTNEPSKQDDPMAEMMAKTDAVSATGAGTYESYAPEKIAIAATDDVVLFFHASWCPSCRSLNSDIEKNLGTIPEGVTILKTDYDKETELKKKYGVTTQHTLVQVDKDGNLIKKWSGGSKLENLLSQIQ